MNQEVFDEGADKPLDPAMERVRRKMIRLLAVAIGTMLIGLMAVLGAIVYKFNSKPSAPAAQNLAETTIPQSLVEVSGSVALPVGAQINSTSLSGNRILFDVSLPDGTRELLIWDIAAGRYAAKLSLTSAGQ